MREPGFWYRPRSLKSHALRPLGAIYGAVAERRMLRGGVDAGVPVICVGNYHVGGAGKTPTVLALVALLRDLGERPIVLSRGYGGRLRGPMMVDAGRHGAADIGDEPLMMVRHVPVAVARDRVGGAALARAQGASVILMDDGFQNPAIRKDLSLVVIDSERGLGNAKVFPAGPLRAPLKMQLSRTDALVVIGAGDAADDLAGEITGRGRPVFRARLVPDAESLAALSGRRVLAFAGIGDPARFFRTLRAGGIDVADSRAFSDHHVYSPREIEELTASAQREGLVLVTTEKDAARISGGAGARPGAQELAVFKVTLAFDAPAGLRAFLVDRLVKARETAFRAR